MAEESDGGQSDDLDGFIVSDGHLSAEEGIDYGDG